MSLVNPETRWWRQAPVMRIAAVVLWSIAFAVAVVTGWSNYLYLAGGVWQHWAAADWLVGVNGVPEATRRIAEISVNVAFWPVAAAFTVDVRYRTLIERGYGWPIAHALGIVLLGIGLGGVVAAVSSVVGVALPVIFSLLGAGTLAIRPVVVRYARLYQSRQEWSRLHGTPVSATVTASGMNIVNGIRRWTATLRFNDAQGRQRWHRASVPTTKVYYRPALGQRFILRYDQEHPGRRFTTYVNLAKPLDRDKGAPRRPS